MRNEDRLITELMIWDMMFDGDLFGNHEPAGCTPYLLMGGAIVGIFSLILHMIPVFLNNFMLILSISIVFTVVLPIINYIRAKKIQVGFIDFIYIILSLINGVLGSLVGFGVLYLVFYNNLKDISLDQSSIYLLAMFFIGYFLFRVVQNLIWNLSIRRLLKEGKI
ncbi:hypothetical protein Amet_4689 [Alkaliphilus metalliredigens QYMF]|uniref:Uncharacterized protein n=1 Tax=Alkaliphilus metalliredigens (strain QYMF) TaxID=293826 RepID=A6TX39_ALKMQ|nr:hypothetical protein [Alkaliphilus metalliredigens]ABR50757.1 hypothetical protein Amet_4689 [Alkaliphilus metalliredigens QYMF]